MREQDLFLRRALLESGLASPAGIDEAARLARERGDDLATALVECGALSARQLALVKADVCEVPFVELHDYDVCFQNANLIPRSVAERYRVFPLFVMDGVLTVATDDPMNLGALDHVRQIVKGEVDAVMCEREQIATLISRVYTLSSRAEDASIDLSDRQDFADEIDAESQPIVAAVNQILADAAEQKASDIHINPDESCLRIRYRVDGVLHEKQGPPLSMHAGIVQRLKVIARLDLTQTRRPQDGKFRFRHGCENIDVRFSTLPTVCGENVVMRLLASRCSINSFHDLGIAPALADQIEEIIQRPCGMFLVTGPTGSGKTTTLYTAINRLNEPSRNIITIEDPVEIRLPYIRQVQVQREIGMTFASALRSILRQDPDIVLVGEIRDEETASIGLQAALTGHLVLSTLHTNDAAGAVSRLRDYAVPPFVINSAVLGVIAQRLVRRICSHCTAKDRADDRLARRFRIESDFDQFARGRGCARCARTGYLGRIGLYELFRLTPQVMSRIDDGEGTSSIRRTAVEEGMRLMWQDGLDKARVGMTTLDEVARVASLAEMDDDGCVLHVREAA